MQEPAEYPRVGEQPGDIAKLARSKGTAGAHAVDGLGDDRRGCARQGLVGNEQGVSLANLVESEKNGRT